VIPRERYDQKRAKMLLEFLIEEQRRASADRREKEEAWIEFQEGYRAKPVDEVKDFPFYGASNLVIPVIATDVDTLFGRLMGMLFEIENLWSVTATMPEMEQIAPRLTEFLKWAQHHEIKPEGALGDWILEILKLGTGVLKQRYQREMKKVYEWRELDQGTWQQQALMLLKDAPAVHRVPIFNFYVPSGYREIQDMPWVSELVELSWPQYQARIRSGLYEPSTRISEWLANSKGNRVSQEFARISGFAQSMGNKLPLHEFWTDFDIDGDGWDEALVCSVHIDTGEYVRLDYNPWFNQDKPYSVARFMRDENSFYGIGVSEMELDFQDEVTAMHNQRIDNGTVRNSQTFAVDKANKNISVNEKVYPSKIWLVNKVDDIKALQLGTTGSGESIQNEQFTLNYAQRRVGTSDYIYGANSPDIGYSTAFTTQQMMLNSDKRQGQNLREIRNALSETGTRFLEMYQQFNQRGKEFFALGAQDGALVRQVLQFPLDLIRRGFKIQVTAIDVQMSKDMQLRTNAIIMQQLMQYYQQVLMGMQYATNPMMPPPIQQMALQMVQGATHMMRRTLDTHGIQDIDKILPDLMGAQQQNAQQLAAIQQLLALGRGQPAPAGPPAASGMGGLPQAPVGLLPATTGGPGYQQRAA
jgi:hypothetical protein